MTGPTALGAIGGVSGAAGPKALRRRYARI